MLLKFVLIRTPINKETLMNIGSIRGKRLRALKTASKQKKMRIYRYSRTSLPLKIRTKMMSRILIEIKFKTTTLI
jgi:hypothetical protein